MFSYFLAWLRQRGQRGQSLVEVALTLPILITLAVGVIEVSNLLITKNRVDTAARAATRFAAQGGDDVHIVALNSVTQTLRLNDGEWDIWLVTGVTNNTGDGFQTGTSGFDVQKIYGLDSTRSYTDVAESLASDCASDCFKDQILDDLILVNNGNRNLAASANLSFASVVIIHDIDSILGLDVLPQFAEASSVTAHAVMRMDQLVSSDSTAGCDAFPIAIHEGVRSLTDVNEGNPYPQASSFDYPDSPPTYAQFFHNRPQVPLSQAKEGYIYKAQNGFGSGNFGWLQWNTGRPASANTLADSLEWPGDSTDYVDHGDNSISPATPNYPHIVRGYVNPQNALDTSLNIGDYVAANTGSVNAKAVRDAVAAHVDRAGRTLRLVVWDQASGTGSNGRYRIKGFIIAKLHGYKLNQGGGEESWILIEFVRWDDSCGQ